MPGQSTKDDPAYNAVGMDGEENPPCIGGYIIKEESPLSEDEGGGFCLDRGEKNGKNAKNAFFLGHCHDLAV
jgi:hypothetical protein